VDLKETKDLYGRLMVLTKSSRDIDKKHAIGNYEFTLTPRALFSPNASLLACTDKSKLIHVLENLIQMEATSDDEQLLPRQAQSKDEPTVLPLDSASSQHSNSQSIQKIAVVDGMVIVQKLAKKPPTVETISDLSSCFFDRVMHLAKGYD